MKYLIVFGLLATAAFAAPVDDAEGESEGEGFVDVTQSSIGTYKYLVKTGNSERTEERLADGSIVGEYTIPGENGVPLTFRYTSGVDGFRIISGPLPVAPVDNNVPVPETPEQIALRTEHLTLHQEAPIQTS